MGIGRTKSSVTAKSCRWEYTVHRALSSQQNLKMWFLVKKNWKNSVFPKRSEIRSLSSSRAWRPSQCVNTQQKINLRRQHLSSEKFWVEKCESCRKESEKFHVFEHIRNVITSDSTPVPYFFVMAKTGDHGSIFYHLSYWGTRNWTGEFTVEYKSLRHRHSKSGITSDLGTYHVVSHEVLPSIWPNSSWIWLNCRFSDSYKQERP